MGNITTNLDKSHFYDVICKPLIKAVLRLRNRNRNRSWTVAKFYKLDLIKIQCVQKLYQINYFNKFVIFSPQTILNDSLFKFSRQ